MPLTPHAEHQDRRIYDHLRAIELGLSAVIEALLALPETDEDRRRLLLGGGKHLDDVLGIPRQDQ